jgi:cobalt/nickel transport system ATP-binding protein
MIQIHSLSFHYPDGRLALEKVEFSVAAGESIGLVGPNGAGKTTLFLCMAGVLRVAAGAIDVAGLDPADVTQRKKLPAKLGIVFQNSDDQLFNSTVFDDVAFGPLNLELSREEVKQRVAEALEKVGLTGFDQRVPFHLSGGEQRRVALAGVLAMRPEILLLDEPSQGLDPRGRRGFIQVVNALNVTKIIAAHDLEMILQTCRRALILDQGRVVADGAARELFADAKLMEAHGLEVPHSLTAHGEGYRHHHAKPRAEEG